MTNTTKVIDAIKNITIGDVEAGLNAFAKGFVMGLAILGWILILAVSTWALSTWINSRKKT